MRLKLSTQKRTRSKVAFKLFSQSPNIPALEYTADASVSFTQGNMGVRDTSSAEIKEGTGTTLTIECIVTKTVTTASSAPVLRAIPIVSGPGQLWVADCTATPAANQLNKAHNLTNSSTVDNTSTTDATTAGIFIGLKIVGPTSDKKILGYFVKIGQVTS